MPISASVEARIRVSGEKTAGLGNEKVSKLLEHFFQIAEGVGLGQADQIYADERTVAAATTDAIDLSGTLKDIFNANVVGVTLVTVMIVNRNMAGVANTTTLTVGGGANPITGLFTGAAHTMPVRPGQAVLFDGSQSAVGLGPIVAATGDILNVVNPAGAANTYGIVLIVRKS